MEGSMKLGFKFQGILTGKVILWYNGFEFWSGVSIQAQHGQG